jgi:hypothetical protein
VKSVHPSAPPLTQSPSVTSDHLRSGRILARRHWRWNEGTNVAGRKCVDSTPNGRGEQHRQCQIGVEEADELSAFMAAPIATRQPHIKGRPVLVSG